MKEFLLGSLSSIFAAFILFLSRRFWITAWHFLFIKIYPNISGKYKLIDKAGAEYRAIFPDSACILEIKQLGRKLSGRAIITSGDSTKLEFEVGGFVTAHKIAVITYVNTTAETQGAGSYVLKMHGVDNRLIGHVAYVCSNCDEVHDYPVELKKLEK